MQFRNQLLASENITNRIILREMGVPKAKVLGKGTFSYFYSSDDEDTVIRLCYANTAQADFYDPMVASYFSQENQKHLPQLLDTCDDINDWAYRQRGDYQMGNVTVSKVERLQPLKNGGRRHHINKAIHLKLKQLGYKDIAQEDVKSSDPDAYLRKNVPAEISDFAGYVDSLGLATRDHGVVCDRVSHDLMVRPSTGELVISDPWFEPTVLNERLKATSVCSASAYYRH